MKPVLEQAVLASPIFATRWRWVAGRALALLRFSHGKKVPPQIQRMRSDDLLAAVFPEAAACQENIQGDISIPDHPLVREAMNEALTEAMDIDGLREVLAAIGDGRIRCIAVDTPVPSQFSHEILNANPYAYLDDAPLEERRARAVEMRRMLPEAVLSEVGRLDPAAIAEVREESWPDVRNADELHDTLLTLLALPESIESEQGNAIPFGASLERSVAAWRDWFGELASASRASRAVVGGRGYLVAAERAKAFSAIFPTAQFDSSLPDLGTQPSREDALLSLITGWMGHIGPCTAADLARALGLARIRRRQDAPAHGELGNRAARPVYRLRRGANRVVRSSSAGAHSQTHDRKIAQRDSAGQRRAIHALAASLAAPDAWNANLWRARHAGSSAAAPGIRVARKFVGAAHSSQPRGRLRPQGLGSAVPHRRGRMGPPLAASGHVAGSIRHATPRDSHQRRSDHVSLCARTRTG